MFWQQLFEGESILSKLILLPTSLSKPNLFAEITGFREVHSFILELVKEGKASREEKNLLQAILSGAKESFTSQYKADAFIVDNCKSIYFAGHETTAATAASWCLLVILNGSILSALKSLSSVEASPLMRSPSEE
ncbi:putative cytochrome P450 superfamily [Dioscorea sansibarensis]